jgi:hypothetical protein
MNSYQPTFGLFWLLAVMAVNQIVGISLKQSNRPDFFVPPKEPDGYNETSNNFLSVFISLKLVRNANFLFMTTTPATRMVSAATATSCARSRRRRRPAKWTSVDSFTISDLKRSKTKQSNDQ